MSCAEDATGVRPLLIAEGGAVGALLPGDTWLLDDAVAIERFLASLDRAPPDWGAVYGPDGHDHDDRLFALNRERDGVRPATAALLTFMWPGELSEYDGRAGGFRVAVGPKVIATAWGLVRFKPDGLPSNLLAVAAPDLQRLLTERAKRGERMEIDVAMTGRLVPEEGIIYDFAHEEAGRGMVMPVVRIERIDYFLPR